MKSPYDGLFNLGIKPLQNKPAQASDHEKFREWSNEGSIGEKEGDLLDSLLLNPNLQKSYNFPMGSGNQAMIPDFNIEYA